MLSKKVIINNTLNGGQVIADTATYTGDWVEIRVITAAVFTTLTGNIEGVGSTSFPAGTILNGRFTVIDLASGSVVAYNAA
jgi:hypothetical protein